MGGYYVKDMIQDFVPNEYVSVCGTLEDGTVLVQDTSGLPPMNI